MELRGNMEKLQIYVKNIIHTQLKNLECFSPYEIEIKDISFTNEFIKQIVEDEPTIYTFRLNQEETNNPEKILRFIDSIKLKTNLARFLIIIENKNFDCAYGCIKHGIDALLVEPVDNVDLAIQLAQLTDNLRKTQKDYKERMRLEEYEFKKRSIIMGRMVKNILEKPKEFEFLLPEINNRYKLNLEENRYRVAIIGLGKYSIYQSNMSFIRAIYKLSVKTLNNANEIIATSEPSIGLIGIINYSEKFSKELAQMELHRLKNYLDHESMYRSDGPISLTVGPIVSSISEIGKSLEKVIDAQEYRMIKNDNVIFAEDVCKNQIELYDIIPQRAIKELVRYVALGNIGAVNNWFAYFFKKYEPDFKQYPPAYRKLCGEIYENIKQLGENNKLTMFPKARFNAIGNVFDGTKRMEELQILLVEMCHIVLDETDNGKEIAHRAIAYMKVHYKEPLTLDVLAEKCNLSTSYFSRKFKEQTGENYIDVLTEIRIKEAEQLLVDTKKPIIEVLTDVGYCDDKHFRKVFFKHTGLTPSKYRKEKTQLVNEKDGKIGEDE